MFHFMTKKLKTTDNTFVEIAVGKEGDFWYVQTTDIHKNAGVYLSESIAENIKSKKKAMKIAKRYYKKYKMNIQEWS